MADCSIFRSLLKNIPITKAKLPSVNLHFEKRVIMLLNVAIVCFHAKANCVCIALRHLLILIGQI